MEINDPYAILGVRADARVETIKDAYQKLALKFHPDKNRSDSPDNAVKKFREIQEAWDLVKDTFEADGVKATIQGAETIPFGNISPKGEMTEVFEHSCHRCGDAVEIYLEDLLGGYNTFQCNSCSTYITIDFSNYRK